MGYLFIRYRLILFLDGWAMILKLSNNIESGRVEGFVRWYDGIAGMGYAETYNDGRLVLIIAEDVYLSGLKGLRDGQKITFEISNKRGGQYATHLKAL